MTTIRDLECCYLEGGRADGEPCHDPAEWLIIHGPALDDYTHACTVHVGALLTDAPEHRIYPVHGKAVGR